MPALRVHDPRRGEAASPFDGQVSPLALHSSALHWLHTHTLTHTQQVQSLLLSWVEHSSLYSSRVSDLLFFLVLPLSVF